MVVVDQVSVNGLYLPPELYVYQNQDAHIYACHQLDGHYVLYAAYGALLLEIQLI